MNLKELVGRQAANYVKDGMIVGLGTGSTAYYFVDEIGQRVQKGLNIIGVTTSMATKKQAEELGIPLKSVDEVPYIDVTVDGADEVNHQLNGIKGGGGALLFEKIVARHSKKIVWVVDKSKVVDTLGKFPLPVEVVKYGSTCLLNYFTEKGYSPVLRQKDNAVFVTDDGNYIIDLHLDKIEDEYALAKELDSLTGVVEHGLFLDMTSVALVGTENGVEEKYHV
ncbi:ribose-5-phosphate isomerase RpiA [Granulicatella sp. zg-ZJ]|uniref:ribose-5-phosphate isomerase RpiA n=1 Tax=unclassified Granulicatella TaxID=2630493 RepID=UPI0013BEBDD8|nr:MULTISPECIES: ribose-5-phosphate isomerase RpiA [unclassified Granulicatella]MBS4750782.1 ribose-5-phosphate isomerase RpiA [Carnobacteriaceae bacterium zg-ZUI78]NEW63185.1 ribose-5-phosphate isomerase RpiA [Granulicatella sp. zg-ZJ]NEW66500.1 ribose-5-phosphate isomerase RpiA [Granulicatella sp. zg-84]QMI85511.1 ribose-5-phosphate isomerase RpiA [Carnobacteriaceae bacterium zg-84]